MRKSMISAGCSIAGLWDFYRLLYRQGAVAFESQKRKEVQEVSRREIFWNVRWRSYGYDPTDFSDLVGSSSSL
jgi:hypothetical protein